MNRTGLISLLIVLLSACGGGGGGGGGGPGIPAKAWGAAQLLETSPGNAEKPQVAFDGAGNAIAVWSQSDGTRLNTWSNRYTNAGGWGSAENIDKPPDLPGTASGTFGLPQLALNAAGTARAVWLQWMPLSNNSSIYRPGVWANTYAPGTGWDVASLVEDLPAADAAAGTPATAIDGGGNPLTIWTQDGSNVQNAIWSKDRNNSPVVVDSAISSSLPAKIARDSAGNAIAVWVKGGQIWASRYGATPATWSAPQNISNSGENTTNPHLAVNSAGFALVVWEGSDGTRKNIRAARFVAGQNGNWVGFAPLEFSFDDATAPRVAIDGDGNGIAVWVQRTPASGLLSVWSNRYTAGNPEWTGPEVVENNNAGDISSPQVAFDAGGNAMVVWSELDEVNTVDSDIWANRHVPGAGWGAPVRLESGTTDSAVDPQIAIDANGNAIAVWAQTEAGVSSIWASRYE